MENSLSSAPKLPAAQENDTQDPAAGCNIVNHLNPSQPPRALDSLGSDLDTSYPQLRNTSSPTSSKPALHRPQSDGEDEEPGTEKGFQRFSGPPSVAQKARDAVHHSIEGEGVCKMHRFTLYETASRFYLVGGDIVDRRFKILKIDRTVESGDLSMAEDEVVYTKKEKNKILNTVDNGNRSSGGLKLRCRNSGLLGFIRFTGAYYMLVITKRSQVALIGGHYIYQVDDTDLVPLTTTTITSSSSSRGRIDRDPEEARFLGILNNLDLSHSFYFSYSYDITRTLQHNMIYERHALREGSTSSLPGPRNAMFIWNHHLLEPASKTLKNTHDWCLPIVHGFVDQASTPPAPALALPLFDVPHSALNLRAYRLHNDHCKTFAMFCWCKIPETWCQRSSISYSVGFGVRG